MDSDIILWYEYIVPSIAGVILVIFMSVYIPPFWGFISTGVKYIPQFTVAFIVGGVVGLMIRTVWRFIKGVFRAGGGG